MSLQFQAEFTADISQVRLIAEYAVEKGFFIPYDSIPDKRLSFALSAEDKNFFNHPGSGR